MNTLKKGFTLIELLVVIAILAVLATVIVVIINPAELLRQARDATRVSDMAALNSAIALYLSDVTTPGLNGQNNGACTVFTPKCGIHAGETVTTTLPFATAGACTGVATTTADGNGWVPVSFTLISSGSPLSRLPLDPAGGNSWQYAYACNGLSYKLGAGMESLKYSNPTTGVTRNNYDGGTAAGWYEVGNKLDL